MVRRPAVDRDLEEIAAFIGEDRPDVALRFLKAAEETFLALEAAPGIGRRREFSRVHLRGIRSWPVKGFRMYLIFYFPLQHGVEIVRVLHGARNLRRTLQERLINAPDILRRSRRGPKRVSASPPFLERSDERSSIICY